MYTVNSAPRGSACHFLRALTIARSSFSCIGQYFSASLSCIELYATGRTVSQLFTKLRHVPVHQSLASQVTKVFFVGVGMVNYGEAFRTDDKCLYVVESILVVFGPHEVGLLLLMG